MEVVGETRDDAVGEVSISAQKYLVWIIQVVLIDKYSTNGDENMFLFPNTRVLV